MKQYCFSLSYLSNISERKFNLIDFDTETSFFIIDDYFRSGFIELYKERLNDYNIFWLRAKEKNKNIHTINKIFNSISEKFNRDFSIVAIGGGICLDVSAFCASVFNRGCKLILFPTTFLSMIDASVGGKTGVNLNRLKNKIGTFYPANDVFIDYDFLLTLKSKQIKEGYAELIKMMIIFDRDFFSRDYQYINVNLKYYIMKSIEFKAKLCQQDLGDSNKRHILNLGHTVGHILESLSGFKLSHGYAVALGLAVMLEYSYVNLLISKETMFTMKKYLSYFCGLKSLNTALKNQIKDNFKKLLFTDKKTSFNYERELKLILINEESVETLKLKEVTDNFKINEFIKIALNQLL